MEQKESCKHRQRKFIAYKNLGLEYSLESPTEFGPDNNDSRWGEEYQANITDRRTENVAAASL